MVDNAPSVDDIARQILRVIDRRQYHDYAPARFGIIDGAGSWNVTPNNLGYPFTFESAGITTHEGRA